MTSPDFFMVSRRFPKQGVVEIFPKFIIRKSSDLMIRGGDFYAVWIDSRGLWSTDEQDALHLIDCILDAYVEENKENLRDLDVRVLHMWDAQSGMIDSWHKYCQKQMRDNFHMLDENIIFSNSPAEKKDYASKKLPYALEKGDTSAFDRILEVLYSPEERKKIEWAIGAVVTGRSKRIQKLMVFYGAPGTGKSTVMNIIQDLFEGYYSMFDAKALGSSNNTFALEAFKTNPLVAIQHDSDLSRIEDNTRLNSLVSHEQMTVNEKFKSTYTNRFKSFLFIGTNKPVCITDSKSGLLRRLIDVTPTGDTLSTREYNKVTKEVKFELGAIAEKCKNVFLNDPEAYNGYVPTNMLGASNDFYNFIEDSYFVLKNEDPIGLRSVWEMYKQYCTDANITYQLTMRKFKEELKSYYSEFAERSTIPGPDGKRLRNCYIGFLSEKFNTKDEDEDDHIDQYLITFKEGIPSLFDKLYADSPAQYANGEEKPTTYWDRVKTKLSDLDTKKIHYVRLPENHIVIDLDIQGEDGEKDFQRNLLEASKWPKTYAEVSKSGKGIHLHYIYTGDPKELSRIIDEHVEVKVFTGKTSLRRKLTKCNEENIATISSGLPLREVKNVVDLDVVKNEKVLRRMIERTLQKKVHSDTSSSVNFIGKLLQDAWDAGYTYDVSNLMGRVLAFSAASTNQSERCIKAVKNMHFVSKNVLDDIAFKGKELVFFDVEVFPNLFVLCWKPRDGSLVKWINPGPKQIEGLIGTKLIGFNNRKYDNHILYARLMGYNNDSLYKLSKKIISGEKDCYFGEAYNLSYTDIYDFSSVKQSLKKFEIEMGIHHDELGLDWDKPVPEDLWERVAEYCGNDVIATEKTFEYRYADFMAREILADVAGMTVNSTTNSLTTRIIFGRDKNPQKEFNYRFMGDLSKDDTFLDDCDEFCRFNRKGFPVFPGYEYSFGKSTYRDEVVGEGGYVYSEPGIYTNVALLDITSMHPSSIINENLFGKYTIRFEELKNARVLIKHGKLDEARKILDGKLAKYLDDPEKVKDLPKALKIAINAVYGLTSAHFKNAFKDDRNIDNIVAKRGALFMVNLKHEVQKRGYTVAHIKTDSIKIPNADKEIIDFVMRFGEAYGYNFEHEDTYDRMCLVNDAVYIAHDKRGWTATGAQFAVPYVFKTLFSKEPIDISDMCEVKSVKSALYLDMNENDPEDHNYRFIGKVGQFSPVKPGCGGGLLMRQADDKFASATGTKGYRWLESETVRTLHKESDIDRTYYNRLVDDAVETISKYGDFELFVDSANLPF